MILVLGRIAAIGLPHLEQRRHRQSRGCGCAARRRAGPAAGSAASTTSRSRSDWRAPARPGRRRSACAVARVMNDQVIASTRPRPASDAARAAHAALGLGEHGARHAGRARHRRRRHLVEADDAHDLLDEIGGAVHVGPPARRGHLHASRPCPRWRSPAPPGWRGSASRSSSMPASFSTRPSGKSMTVLVSGGAPAILRLGRLAARHLHHHGGGEIEARQDEGRIDAALEAIARIARRCRPCGRWRPCAADRSRRTRSARSWSRACSRCPRRRGCRRSPARRGRRRSRTWSRRPRASCRRGRRISRPSCRAARGWRRRACRRRRRAAAGRDPG